VSAGATSIEIRTCRGCGCTDGRACFGGCSWATEDVCSTCFMAYELLATFERAPRGTLAKRMTPLQIEVRALARVWGRDEANFIRTLAVAGALGGRSAALALGKKQNAAATARPRSVMRAPRVAALIREARKLVSVARTAVS